MNFKISAFYVDTELFIVPHNAKPLGKMNKYWQLCYSWSLTRNEAKLNLLRALL